MELFILDHHIHCVVANETQWIMPINKIVFIGEYTTSAGPWVQDWFIVLAQKADEWYEFPCLDVTDCEFWTELGRHLNCEVFPLLISSTELKSNVIYPKGLEGEELFKIVKTEDTCPNMFQKLLRIKAVKERVELSDKIRLLFAAQDAGNQITSR